MTRSQKLLAVFFTIAGILHFVRPRSYEAIMPEYIPYHSEVVFISGVAEVAGGLALVSERTRPFARWWLIGLLIAVFPANLHMALNPEDIRGLDMEQVPRWALWARLPLQAAAVYWVIRATEKKRR